MNLAVIGTEEFVFGFRLTGIKDCVATKNPQEEIKKFLTSKEIGIVFIDQESMDVLNEHTKELVINSLQPVFVTISAHASQAELRSMVQKSIGVDLLGE